MCIPCQLFWLADLGNRCFAFLYAGVPGVACFEIWLQRGSLHQTGVYTSISSQCFCTHGEQMLTPLGIFCLTFVCRWVPCPAPNRYVPLLFILTCLCIRGRQNSMVSEHASTPGEVFLNVRLQRLLQFKCPTYITS